MQTASTRTAGRFSVRADGASRRSHCCRGVPLQGQAVVAAANSSFRGLVTGSKPFAGETLCARPSGHHRAGSAMHAPGAGRARLRISAVFERFTESSIKSVMLAQQESKLFGSPQVRSLSRWFAKRSWVLACPPDSGFLAEGESATAACDHLEMQASSTFSLLPEPASFALPRPFAYASLSDDTCLGHVYVYLDRPSAAGRSERSHSALTTTLEAICCCGLQHAAGSLYLLLPKRINDWQVLRLQVCTEHLLLGLVAEGTVKGAAAGGAEQRSCLAPIRLEAARAEVCCPYAK
jgi:hypothetical protein